jgi:hypothetical protein
MSSLTEPEISPDPETAAKQISEQIARVRSRVEEARAFLSEAENQTADDMARTGWEGRQTAL